MANKLFEIQTQEIEDGTNLMKGQSKLQKWSCQPPYESKKLKNGTCMFEGCFNLSYVSDEFSSLTNGTAMFKSCEKLNMLTVDLSSLEYAEGMFKSIGATITKVNTNYNDNETLCFTTGLPNLQNGASMFEDSYVNFFVCDMPMLKEGIHMFSKLRHNGEGLAFHSTLEELYSGEYMFSYSYIQVINTLHPSNDYSGIYISPYRDTYFISMPKLQNGTNMFNKAGKDFDFISSWSNWDLSSLENGGQMFYESSLVYDFFASTANLTNADNMFKYSSLSNFNSPLWSLDGGEHMFDGARMTIESIQNIATTIKTNPTSPRTNIFYTDNTSLSTNHAVQAAHLHLKDKGWNVSIPAYSFSSTTLPTNVDNGYWYRYLPENAYFTGILGKYACGYITGKGETVFGLIDTDSITRAEYMFAHTSIKNWSAPLSNLTNANYMFSYSYLENFYCPTPISAEHINTMFQGCSNLKSVYMIIDGYNKISSTGIPVASMFDSTECPIMAIDMVGNYVYSASYMCRGCYNLSAVKMSLPELKDATGMFAKCDSLVHTNDLYIGGTGQLNNVEYMFVDCGTLTTVPHYSIRLASGTIADSMFMNCKSLRVVDQTATQYGVCLDLSKIKRGRYMFYDCSNLTTFNSNLSSLTNGNSMFYYCSKLKSFTSDLSSLTNGYCMFRNCFLNSASVQNISETIKDVRDLTNIDPWGEIYKTIHIDIDNQSPNEQEKAALNNIASKGWTVYVKGNTYTPTATASIMTLDELGNEIETPIPYYAKPIPAYEEHGDYIDSEGNYYNILGAQFIYGDDLSTYGMFTSEEDAAANMRLTKIER